ncbi:Uncharacterised protein [Salmonella enterica subsp. enterica serovar Bovismorbificans]|nr:Uncharacterised protein [Salmonella enterica subsp. enterica serovar Bovismorbificans]CPR56778.1 Uncharacterised protein [Salmonella enterica subsp. enterica serovar Bovismorbificans]
MVTDFIVLQIVVGIPTLFVIPQMHFNGFLPRVGQRVILRGFGPIARRSVGAREGFLQLIQQSVKIDRDNRGGTNGTELLRIIHPAGAEIPAGGGGRSEVSIDLRCRAVGVAFGGSDIFNPGFRAGRIPIVPVAVENAAVLQFDDALVLLPWLQCLNALHPVGVLFLQLRQVFFQRIVTFMLRQ